MCEDWNKWVGGLESLGNDDFRSIFSRFTKKVKATINNIKLFSDIK